MNLKSILRPTAFRLGYVIGLSFSLLVIALFQWFSENERDYDIEIIGVGADLDAHRARDVLLTTDRGVLFSQTCRGGCDDLWQRADLWEGVFELRVLDQGGACVACGEPAYVTGIIPAGWNLRGRERLDGNFHFLKGAPNIRLKDWRPAMPKGD